MKVLLADLAPRAALFAGPLWTPLYLARTGSVLREAGHDVSLVERGTLDARVRRDPAAVLQAFQEHTRGFQPDLVWFDVTFESYPALLPFARTARQAAPRARVVAGGRYPTASPEQTLQQGEALDLAVIGEPERAAPALADGADASAIGSLAFRANGDVIRTAPAPALADLDALPFPAWDLLDISYHTHKTARVIPCLILRTLTTQTSRGCRGTCRFCYERGLFGGRLRFHSGAYVAEMVGQMAADYPIRGLYFSDENFTASAEHCLEICEELVAAGLHKKLRWAAQARADTTSEELLRAMRRAGCVQLEYGIESGSQRLLDFLNKGTTVAGNTEALARTRQAGIRSLAYMLVNLPGETPADYAATAAFLEAANPDLVRLNRWNPYPGVALSAQLVREGAVSPDCWNLDTREPTGAARPPANLSGLPDPEYQGHRRRLYRRHVLPRYLRDLWCNNRWWEIPGLWRTGPLARFLWRLVR